MGMNTVFISAVSHCSTAGSKLCFFPPKITIDCICEFFLNYNFYHNNELFFQFIIHFYVSGESRVETKHAVGYDKLQRKFTLFELFFLQNFILPFFDARFKKSDKLFLKKKKRKNFTKPFEEFSS